MVSRLLIAIGATLVLSCSTEPEADEPMISDPSSPNRSEDRNPTPGADVDGCVDLVLFQDRDGDGFGASQQTLEACLAPGESIAGYARQAGDCAPDDAWVHPGRAEICGDFFDDDCSGEDEGCPTTMAGDLNRPVWDCTNGSPDKNVYAWARFDDGGEYFMDGGCFIFFEGLPGEFYVERKNITDLTRGSTCPSAPSYDRRMYAWLLRGEAEACEDIALNDRVGSGQTVSNHCRKYLLQMFGTPATMAYVGGQEALSNRLTHFPRVEIGCARDDPHDYLPFASLLVFDVQLNEGFEAQ